MLARSSVIQKVDNSIVNGQVTVPNRVKGMMLYDSLHGHAKEVCTTFMRTYGAQVLQGENGLQMVLVPLEATWPIDDRKLTRIYLEDFRGIRFEHG